LVSVKEMLINSISPLSRGRGDLFSTSLRNDVVDVLDDPALDE